MLNLKYVLENEISRDQCPHCLAVWFRFNHEGKLGVYRLGFDEPGACRTCTDLDEKIESDSSFVASAERWFDL